MYHRLDRIFPKSEATSHHVGSIVELAQPNYFLEDKTTLLREVGLPETLE